MKVCGFSFIRNAILYDYPIVEALTSILPVCDQVFVAVGKSEDDTRNLVASISDKIVIIDTVWDNNLRDGGKVLAKETQKAYDGIADTYDWCIYIQGDEVLHQDDYEEIKKSMLQWKDDPIVDGLLFNYKHFYGSYDYFATSGRWYTHEIRIVRHRKDIFSYGDAMGFRKSPDQKLKVKPINATVYHYGWVKHPEDQQNKQKTFHKLWSTDDEIEKKVDIKKKEFNYAMIDRLSLFKANHPNVMQKRISQKNWAFNFDPSIDRRTYIERVRSWIKSKTGWRPGEYKNYQEI